MAEPACDLPSLYSGRNSECVPMEAEATTSGELRAADANELLTSLDSELKDVDHRSSTERVFLSMIYLYHEEKTNALLP
jgi:hypothetical protein